jgi:hypothetical protein
MQLHAQFVCLLPEECPHCLGQDFAIGGHYPDHESGFEADIVVCQICQEEMDELFIIRNAESIAEKAEPYSALRQDFADQQRENMR